MVIGFKVFDFKVMVQNVGCVKRWVSVICLMLMPNLIMVTPRALAQAPPKVVRLTGIDWGPYEGQGLPNNGLATEIVTTAFNRVGYRVELTYMPWARVLKELEFGRYDGTVSAYKTANRQHKFSFSNAFLTSAVVFYKRVEKPIVWSKLTDLKPWSIGVVRGYANSQAFDNANYLTKDLANSNLSNLKKLVANHVDLVVIDRFVARHLLQNTLMANIHDVVPIEPVLMHRTIHTMFSKSVVGYQQKMTDFNRGLALITEDKTLQKLLSKHGFD